MTGAESPIAVEEELNCPLCGYDLRGLPSQRCPECGYDFDPADLRQRLRERRQWFFEHAQRRLIRSFVLTTLSALWPPDLWRRIAAAHVIVPRRLLFWRIFWLVATLACAVVFLGSGMLLTQWAYVTFGIASTPTRQQVSFLGAAEETLFARRSAPGLIVFLIIALLPSIELMALGVFGTTFKRASIPREQLLRCVGYAMPGTLLPATSILLYDLISGDTLEWYPRDGFDQFVSLIGLTRGSAIALIAVAVPATFNLCVAHRRYLRVPQALAQALLVSAVVWLGVSAAIVVAQRAVADFLR